MKKLLFCLAMFLIANIALAQKSDKDSVEKSLRIQEYVLETLDKHASTLNEELDSVNQLLKRTDEVLFLISSGTKMLKTIKPKDSVFVKKIVFDLIFEAFYEEEYAKAQIWKSIKILAETNLLISKNIDEQNSNYEQIISDIDYTKQSEEVKAMLEKTHENQNKITEKFIENYLKNKMIQKRIGEFRQKEQNLLEQMSF